MFMYPQQMVRFPLILKNVILLPCKKLTLNHLNYWCCPRKPFVVVSSWTLTDIPLLLGFGFVRKKGSRTIWKLLKSWCPSVLLSFVWLDSLFCVLLEVKMLFYNMFDSFGTRFWNQCLVYSSFFRIFLNIYQNISMSACNWKLDNAINIML